jgi:hypothetical protein
VQLQGQLLEAQDLLRVASYARRSDAPLEPACHLWDSDEGTGARPSGGNPARPVAGRSRLLQAGERYLWACGGRHGSAGSL